jgi:hypothetical protein
MAISRFSTSRVGAGLPKYQKLWDGTTVVENNSFESIATTTVGAGGTATVTFSSIPQTYKHLQLRASLKTSAGTTGFDDMWMIMQSDGTNNYNWHRLVGNGTNIPATAVTSDSHLVFNSAAPRASSTTMFGIAVIDILDYKDSNKYKTTRAVCGCDLNGSGEVVYTSGTWRSNSAIDSFSITLESNHTIDQYSKFALYGIKG